MDINKYLNEHENKDLLRFITCGSVDDGKSTLIGRLLYDSKLIFEDQLRTLRNDSDKVGTTRETGEIDYALLLDGLKAEREQGITIDVAYRYFSTPKRKFIIADTPGHEQYTRNMATGASTASLAVILIDARQGVLSQTRRHAFIVSLLGIKHVVVAVNKMDLVDYSVDVFHDIRREFEEFSAKLDIPDITYIPLSALKGDNVVEPGGRMPWYNGQPLMEYLENVDVEDSGNLTDFRFPVQYVIRPNLDFRGFAGTVVSGVVRKGDRIRVLPSGRESEVKDIVTWDGSLDEAYSPQAVTLVLEDEIDVSSGDMIVHSGNPPKVANSFEAYIVWMDEKALKPGKQYTLRHAGRNQRARIDSVLHRIDVNDLHKSKAGELALNEIGRVVISCTRDIYFDAYSKNRETGSLILIDPLTNNTVGAAMIAEGVLRRDTAFDEDFSETDVLQTHIDKREFFWDSGYVDVNERTIRNRHRGKAVIFTGGESGKRFDLAKKLERKLFRWNMNSYYLGVRNITEGLDADLGMNFTARDEHLRRLGELARIMTDAGLIFISAVDDFDSLELKNLKILNQPNELIIVNVGSDEDGSQADIHLNGASEPDIALDAVTKLLSERNIIPEYCI